MNKKIYIILTVICLIGLIALNSLFLPSSSKDSKASLLEKEQIAKGSQSLGTVILGLAYLLIFFTGIINLIIFSIRKIRKKPLINVEPQENMIALPTKKIPKLFFLIIISVFQIC